MAKFNGIRAKEENSTITGTSANDSISVGYSSVKADADAGDDVILLANRFFNFDDLTAVTITGGEGNDSIKVSPNFNSVEAIVTDFTKDDSIVYEGFGFGREITYSTVEGGIVISDNQITARVDGDTVTEEVDPTFSLTLQGVTDIKDIADAKFYRSNGFGRNTVVTLGDLFGLSADSSDTDSDTAVVMPEGLKFDERRAILTASKDFAEDKIDVDDFDAKHVNARRAKNDIEIIGNDENNSLRGGKGDDTISGGDGRNTLTGGKGEDIFVHSVGRDFITDYKSGEDVIQLNDTEVESWRISGRNVIFTTEEGSITVKNGKGKEITFVDEDGEEFTQTYNNKRGGYFSRWFDDDDDGFDFDDDFEDIITNGRDDNFLDKIKFENDFDSLTNSSGSESIVASTSEK